MSPSLTSRLILAVTGIATIAVCNASEQFCPELYHKGVLELDVNPAFLNVDEYYNEYGEKQQGLTISSFYHFTFTCPADPADGVCVPNPPFAADQVGRIENIKDVDPASFDFESHYQKLTDLEDPPKTTWPNDAQRIPDGMLPFEGVIIPQGFHPIPTAGRLTIVNLDTPDLREYIVHEATLDPPPGGDDDEPRFFHKALFYDMDDDGLLDIVTVRSGFKVLPPYVYPPFSELVYYKNPGDDGLDPDIEWEERILYGGIPPFLFGPDIYLAMYDLDGDGVPEIVATHFFTGDDPTKPQPTKGKIVMYGAPFGESWKDVNGTDPNAQPRIKLINESQGFPFSIEIVDLNGDGKMEILATNHQPNCLPFPGIPGRVYVLEQPESGNVFNDDWTVRVLLDGILPQPTPPGARGMRLAPGHAIPFHPKRNSHKRPWILVSGDEAGKVWMMKPKGRDFEYKTAVIFDINDYYGEGTTQTFTPQGLTISTIGEPAIRYEYDASKKKAGFLRKKKNHGAAAEIYIPVFEAKEIHIFSFDKDKGEESIDCPSDVTYECPAPPPQP